MAHTESNYWWLFLIRGIFALLFGVLALLMPGITFATLVIFFGAFMLVNGVFTIITAISRRKTAKGWGWLVAFGILGILAGIITFYNPFAAALGLVYLFASWALISGTIEIILAIRLRKEIKGEGWYIAEGIITFLFGILLLINPLAGVFTLTILFGIYALIMGFSLIALSFRVKKHEHEPISIHAAG
jgi:uncharacterized membrane protein HdeD (DUF308 family)